MSNARVPDELRDGPFTTGRAASLGVSQTALAGRQWRQLLRGVWVHAGVPDSRDLRLAAVGLVLRPDSFICGPTSSWVRGVDIQDSRNELLWVGYRGDRRPRRREGCLVQRVSVTEDEVELVDGVAMTTPLRTAFDCGRWLAVVEGVVVADALAHCGSIDLYELAALARTRRGLRGIRNLDAVVELADRRSESPMESRVRVLLIRAGLPSPEPQVDIMDVTGRFVARADLAYRRQRLAIEYDGAWHWEQRRHDDRRRDAMRRAGWQVIVVSSEDYYRAPQTIVAQVRAALASRG